MDDFFTSGSLFLVFAALVGAGMGLPISEDIVVLTTGALANRGVFELIPALATCLAGILIGDFIIFSVARALGPPMFQTKLGKRLMTDERRESAQAMLERRGPITVFFARFLIGFRIPAFATAGAFGMRRRDFLLFDALGLSLSGPLVFFVGYGFSQQLPAIIEMIQELGVWVPVIVVSIILILAVVVRRRRSRAQPVVVGPPTSEEE